MLAPRMAALSVVSVAVFLGLAVTVSGGMSALLANGPFLFVIAASVAMVAAALFTRASLGSGVREDRANRWVVVALGGLGLAIAVLPPFCQRVGWLVVDGVSLRWFGAGLYAFGGALRLAPVFALGERFSGLVAIQPGHKLLTTGLYATIRHPSYLGMLVLCIGWSLTFGSLVGLALVGLMLVPLIARIRAEERLLAEHFGAEYEAYRARTSRLLPGIY